MISITNWYLISCNLSILLLYLMPFVLLPNRFLNTSFIILYLFILQMACSTTILLLEWFLLFILLPLSLIPDSSSFLIGNSDFCFRIYFYYTLKSRIKHVHNILGYIGIILFVDLVIMSFTYLLVFCLVDYQSLLVCRIQVLNSVFLFLSWVIYLLTCF